MPQAFPARGGGRGGGEWRSGGKEKVGKIKERGWVRRAGLIMEGWYEMKKEEFGRKDGGKWGMNGGRRRERKERKGMIDREEEGRRKR